MEKINLQVEPIDQTFEIVINDFSMDTIRAEGNRVVIYIPILDDPYRKISITCRETRQWKLLNFGCEFT